MLLVAEGWDQLLLLHGLQTKQGLDYACRTKGMADGMSVALDEDTDDRKHDHILFFEMIFGADKTQFNGMDYGMITVDSAYTAAV